VPILNQIDNLAPRGMTFITIPLMR